MYGISRRHNGSIYIYHTASLSSAGLAAFSGLLCCLLPMLQVLQVPHLKFGLYTQVYCWSHSSFVGVVVVLCRRLLIQSA
jgi:hypothetical protein